jgi:hypothetical protein
MLNDVIPCNQIEQLFLQISRYSGVACKKLYHVLVYSGEGEPTLNSGSNTTGYQNGSFCCIHLMLPPRKAIRNSEIWGRSSSGVHMIQITYRSYAVSVLSFPWVILLFYLFSFNFYYVTIHVQLFQQLPFFQYFSGNMNTTWYKWISSIIDKLASVLLER